MKYPINFIFFKYDITLFAFQIILFSSFSNENPLSLSLLLPSPLRGLPPLPLLFQYPSHPGASSLYRIRHILSY